MQNSFFFFILPLDYCTLLCLNYKKQHKQIINLNQRQAYNSSTNLDKMKIRSTA